MRRRILWADVLYRCGWACERCGRENRERSSVRAFDPLRLNQFADNWQDEVHFSGEVAQEKARKRLFRLQARVNMKNDLRGLRVTGVCRKCGRQQRWAPARRHALAAVMAALTFAALCLGAGVPAEGSLWAAYAAAAVSAALFAEAAALGVTRWRLRRGPESCRPWVEEIFRDA